MEETSKPSRDAAGGEAKPAGAKPRGRVRTGDEEQDGRRSAGWWDDLRSRLETSRRGWWNPD